MGAERSQRGARHRCRPVPGAVGVADLRWRMVLWRSRPKRGVETAFAIAVFQPLSQMHLDVRKGIHLLSPCNNTAAIPSCLFDGKLTGTTQRRLAARLLAVAQGQPAPSHRPTRACSPSGAPLGRGKLRHRAALRLVLAESVLGQGEGLQTPSPLLPTLHRELCRALSQGLGRAGRGSTEHPPARPGQSCTRLKMRRRAPAGPLIHFPDI